MKIGVLSDTHLHSVTDDLKKVVEGLFADADLILHAGDIVGGAVLNYLEAHDCVAVRGNMDLPEVVQSLPIKRVIKAGEYKIGLIHGFGAPRGLAEALRKEFDDIDCLVFGHSHQIMNQMVGDELWFNPGSATNMSGRGSTVGILEIGDRLTGRIVDIN
jgi:putative phosphoesterase